MSTRRPSSISDIVPGLGNHEEWKKDYRALLRSSQSELTDILGTLVVEHGQINGKRLNDPRYERYYRRHRIQFLDVIERDYLRKVTIGRISLDDFFDAMNSYLASRNSGSEGSRRRMKPDTSSTMFWLSWYRITALLGRKSRSHRRAMSTKGSETARTGTKWPRPRTPRSWETRQERGILSLDGKAPRIFLTEEEKEKCWDIAKKIVQEDRRLGAKPTYGSNSPETLLQANYQGLCAELAVSKFYPGSIPEAFKINFSKPHPIGGPDIIIPNGPTIQVKSTHVFPRPHVDPEIKVDPCKVGPERKWRFCDYTYVVYYRDADLQIVASISLAELKKCPGSEFGRLLRLSYENYWKGRVEK